MGNGEEDAKKIVINEQIDFFTDMNQVIESEKQDAIELEKEKKSLERDLKREEKKISILDKELVVHWLEQFKNGDIEDEEFVKSLIDLLVNSVTVWDEPDGTFRVEVAYNLTDMPTKTYRLHPNDRDGTLSDLSPVDQHCISNPIIHGSLLIRTIRPSRLTTSEF